MSVPSRSPVSPGPSAPADDVAGLRLAPAPAAARLRLPLGARRPPPDTGRAGGRRRAWPEHPIMLVRRCLRAVGALGQPPRGWAPYAHGIKPALFTLGAV